MVSRSLHSQVSEPAVYPNFTRFTLHPTDSCAQPVKSLPSGPSSMSATRETLCRWNLEVQWVLWGTKALANCNSSKLWLEQCKCNY